MNYTEVFLQSSSWFSLFLSGVLTDSLVSFCWFLLSHHRPHPPSLKSHLHPQSRSSSSSVSFCFRFSRRVGRRLRWSWASHRGLTLSLSRLVVSCSLRRPWPGASGHSLLWLFSRLVFEQWIHPTAFGIDIHSASMIILILYIVWFSIVLIAFIFSYWRSSLHILMLNSYSLIQSRSEFFLSFSLPKIMCSVSQC